MHHLKQHLYHGIRPTDPNGRKGLRNPERGFRFELYIGREPGETMKAGKRPLDWPFDDYAADGVTIAQGYCYLDRYHDAPIGPGKIEALERDFARARASGVKFLLRFAYEHDFTTTGPTTERILSHIEQLTPVIRRNIDVIHTLQTGWVGLWGEFHTSRHAIEKDPVAVGKIVGATLRMLPPGHFTMMRRIEYKAKALEALGDPREITRETAYTDAPHARIGFFNDGTLANYWDGGTFVDPPHAAPGNWEFDRAAREGAYMSVDGELFWTGQFQEPGIAEGIPAARRFRHHHYTTFSLVHGFSELDVNPEKSVIDHWKEEPVTPALLQEAGLPFDPDYFHGVDSRTAFEYIRDHLGYRIAVPEARFDEEARPGGPFSAEITLTNDGCSAPIHSRPLLFVLTDGEKCLAFPSDLDVRDLQPTTPGHRAGLTATLRATLPDDIAPGAYRLACWLPDREERLRDRPEYAMRLASDLPVEIIGGRLLHLLGDVTITR